MGDFNASLAIQEFTSGSSRSTLPMREFKECGDQLCMTDVNRTGLQFTWNQRPNSTSGILKKINRIMANDFFLQDYPDAFAIFQPFRNSDHSPSILRLPKAVGSKRKPFCFSNHVAFHEDFLNVVDTGWRSEVEGHKMYKIVKKLRMLKKPLRKLMWAKGNLHERVQNIRKDLDDIQYQLDKNPHSKDIRVKESETLKLFDEAVLDEERFLKQKSKIEWLRVGDSNSSYFHKFVQGKKHRSKINNIVDHGGNVHQGVDVPNIFVDHYIQVLGNASTCNNITDPQNLFSNRLPPDIAQIMIRPVDTSEVKDVVFNFGVDKSPGPDGYSAAIFKHAWDIIGDEVVEAIKDFFSNGQFLKEINHTTISLLPKIQVPSKVNDFRPIYCCNVIYKIISRIITNRIRDGLKYIVSDNQSAFIPGRRISDNILLTQDLMKNYHLDRGIPICAFKVDI
ncbi:uncharacterized protein [Rutidosis leptorrhynchoides]|uniref:uncharacterized protein n=1 Tax=Rutidosis leptorrhynchoides TaxID=125765 RepID=UPI003A99FCED